ncbi:hypothetical protein C1H87_03775 [Flavivirga eckloniae]|uniref:HTH araC/xylS-type domain-containing protein n=2 Tax=Flavivirga eckloniae TaxID=1803846 RepID=A0A2K9PMR8_9FLAO|nr:hypothetical protein C1H87_03775 [Flavivirga eckloniae]
MIVKSCIKMPFMKVDEERQMLYSDTPFVKGEFSYVELEPGLWIMNSTMLYKNNVSYRPIYDKMLESNYYCVTISLVENKFNADFYEFDNYKVESHSITFVKPATDFLFCHFKGSKEKMYILYFSETWAKNNIMNSPSISIGVKNLFSNKSIEVLNYIYDKKEFSGLIRNLSYYFNNSPKPNLLELKKITYHFFDLFFSSLEKRDTRESFKLSLKEQMKIEKIEHFLKGNLYNKFPGIEIISDKFNIAPSTLKRSFKLVYGTSVFKYFQNKQMDLALDYFKSHDTMVKDVSQIFGYENVSKFSSAFQKRHNMLPSEIK